MSEMIAAFNEGMRTTRDDAGKNLRQEEPSQSEHEQDISPPSYQETYPTSEQPPVAHPKQLPTVPVVYSESEWKSHYTIRYLYWTRELKENGHLSTQCAIGTGDRSRIPPSSNPPEVLVTCKRQPRVKRTCKGKEVKNAIEALARHRADNSCTCDFEHLGNRVKGSGHYGDVREESSGRRCDRKARRLAGFFVRQYMNFHDDYCSCGCFGQPLR